MVLIFVSITMITSPNYPKNSFESANFIIFQIVSDDTFKKNRAKEIADQRLSGLNSTQLESEIAAQ